MSRCLLGWSLCKLFLQSLIWLGSNRCLGWSFLLLGALSSRTQGLYLNQLRPVRLMLLRRCSVVMSWSAGIRTML